MAPYTIHFFSTPSEADLLSALNGLSPPPLTVARAYGWVSPSKLSATLRDSSAFNVVAIIPGISLSAPSQGVGGLAKAHFATTITVQEVWIDSYAERHKAFMATVSEDLSPLSPVPQANKNGNLDTNDDGDDEDEVEFPLTEELRRTIEGFSKQNSGPVTMLNLLSFHEGTREKYMKYVEGFQAKIGPKYGAAPRLLGEVVAGDEDAGEKKWEMVGLIHYPSAATFARMLQDDVYKDLDRTWKKGVVKDNPILMVVEESVGQAPT